MLSLALNPQNLLPTFFHYRFFVSPPLTSSHVHPHHQTTLSPKLSLSPSSSSNPQQWPVSSKSATNPKFGPVPISADTLGEFYLNELTAIEEQYHKLPEVVILDAKFKTSSGDVRVELPMAFRGPMLFN
ncbi:unnamed protein product [Aspergillus oryzae RIB40]|uniref:DNA, SC010 n=2 Tax=Aspergillus oryzae TaxID=5062 RepID=Q2TWU0_ASPOR|nr:unnamed protein product [Aspergillus oryzae RIB40]EIT75780.1 hypothetical protein Ao3042_08412 [Aspergillus oryzae 3.042]KDE81876.1 hypothetical protein AO1008_08283 [Aspergillus oryzae 100-8]BAE66283.1 unnamed protein product [Aspergillus oryzae RIB40]|eukprot:EIT75780.1 hypothetical protein Ao3042_08412 [Aspergillus oryzae 3.042]